MMVEAMEEEVEAMERAATEVGTMEVKAMAEVGAIQVVVAMEATTIRRRLWTKLLILKV